MDAFKLSRFHFGAKKKNPQENIISVKGAQGWTPVSSWELLRVGEVK